MKAPRRGGKGWQQLGSGGNHLSKALGRPLRQLPSILQGRHRQVLKSGSDEEELGGGGSRMEPTSTAPVLMNLYFLGAQGLAHNRWLAGEGLGFLKSQRAWF